MQPSQIHKLDNPVWHSLNETHREHSLTYDNLKCYKPEYCIFGGFENGNDISKQLDEYAKITDKFYIVGEKPEYSNRLVLNKYLVCLQMIIDDKVDFEIQEDIQSLNNDNNKEVYKLVNLVQPGYFQTATMQLGDYYGIYKNGKLVALTGERMKMNEYIEVSAIVTHPDYLRKGYAIQLIAHTVNSVFDQNKTAYLHVAETNVHAIALYERLGFRIRRKINFWNYECF